MCFSFDVKDTFRFSKEHVACFVQAEYRQKDIKTSHEEICFLEYNSMHTSSTLKPHSLHSEAAFWHSCWTSETDNIVETLILTRGPETKPARRVNILEISGQLQPISALSWPWIASRARRGGRCRSDWVRVLLAHRAPVLNGIQGSQPALIDHGDECVCSALPG